jgi:DNA-binding GntR family transcriptional regulator
MQGLAVRTLTEQIAEQLREDVLKGRYSAGERLSQESLARRFQVSRIPVRDALRLLEAEGLVLNQARYGTTVADLSASDLVELYEMRMALEPALVMLATPKMRESDVVLMARHLESMARPGTTQEAWLKAHAAFHDVLNARAGMARMCALVDGLRVQTERYIRLYKDVAENANDLTADHKAIFEAVSRGDRDAAALAVREHMKRVRDRLLTLLDATEEDVG